MGLAAGIPLTRNGVAATVVRGAIFFEGHA